jgi:hypothetical protein
MEKFNSIIQAHANDCNWMRTDHIYYSTLRRGMGGVRLRLSLRVSSSRQADGKSHSRLPTNLPANLATNVAAPPTNRRTASRCARPKAQ